MLRHVVARPSVGGHRSGRSGGLVRFINVPPHSSTSDRLFDLCHRGFEEPIVGKGAGPAPSITLPISASRGDPPGRAFGWEELKFQTGRSAVGGVRLLGGRCWCRCAAKPADAVADVGDAVPVSHDRPPNGPASRAAARQPAVCPDRKGEASLMGDNRAMHYVVTAAATAVEPARSRPRARVGARLDPVSAGRPAVPDRADQSWPPVACQGMGEWPFFGADAEGAYARARRVGLAKAICASCPAMLQCRSFAVRTGQVFGIWGGLSEQELRFLQHKSAPVKHRGNESPNGS